MADLNAGAYNWTVTNLFNIKSVETSGTGSLLTYDATEGGVVPIPPGPDGSVPVYDSAAPGGFTTGDVSSLLPPGLIFPYAGSVAPTGFALCNGASLAVAAFPALHSVIGYTYGGAGANFNLPDMRGRTTVGLLAADPEFGVLNNAGGAKTVTLATANLPAHSHPVTDPGHVHTVNDGGHSHGLTQNFHNHSITGNTHSHNVYIKGTGGTPLPAGKASMLAGFDVVDYETVVDMTANYSFPPGSNTTDTTQLDLVNGANANISLNTQTTGITTGNTGTGTAVTTLSPYRVLNYIIKT